MHIFLKGAKPPSILGELAAHLDSEVHTQPHSRGVQGTRQGGTGEQDGSLVALCVLHTLTFTQTHTDLSASLNYTICCAKTLGTLK